jgi:hypothetical protein
LPYLKVDIQQAFEIEVDASGQGMGLILMQQPRPLTYLYDTVSED